MEEYIIDKYFCECPQCGNQAKVDMSIILTSNPPQYRYFCPICNSFGSTYNKPYIEEDYLKAQDDKM